MGVEKCHCWSAASRRGPCLGECQHHSYQSSFRSIQRTWQQSPPREVVPSWLDVVGWDTAWPGLQTCCSLLTSSSPLMYFSQDPSRCRFRTFGLSIFHQQSTCVPCRAYVRVSQLPTFLSRLRNVQRGAESSLHADDLMQDRQGSDLGKSSSLIQEGERRVGRRKRTRHQWEIDGMSMYFTFLDT